MTGFFTLSFNTIPLQNYVRFINTGCQFLKQLLLPSPKIPGNISIMTMMMTTIQIHELPNPKNPPLSSSAMFSTPFMPASKLYAVIYYSESTFCVTPPACRNSKPPYGWPFFSLNVIIQASAHARFSAGCSKFSKWVEEQEQEQNYEEQNRAIVT